MINRKQIPKCLAPYCIAFEKSVGAIIFCNVNSKIQFLLIKYRSGHWEFPRGRVEDDETEYETMKREIKEETNISQLQIIEGLRESMSFSYKAHGQELINRKRDGNCMYVHKRVVFYLAQTLNKEVIISHEHQQFRWLEFDDAYEKLTFQNAKLVLKEANRYLLENVLIKY